MTHDVRLSKRLSRWLRHRPEEAGLRLDPQGWAELEPVLAALRDAGLKSSSTALQDVIANNDKQRFELAASGTHIRARQGHSVEVDLQWPAVQPPETLFHGTVGRFLPAIMAHGLKPMKRHHVHLSPDVATARQVGARRGAPVILAVRAGELARHGHKFLKTANGVWLVEAVPAAFLSVLEQN